MNCHKEDRQRGGFCTEQKDSGAPRFTKRNRGRVNGTEHASGLSKQVGDPEGSLILTRPDRATHTRTRY